MLPGTWFKKSEVDWNKVERDVKWYEDEDKFETVMEYIAITIVVLCMIAGGFVH